MGEFGRLLKLLLLFGPFELCRTSLPNFAAIPGLDQKVYAKRGDINIGFTTAVHSYSATEFCGQSYSETGAQLTELPAFMVELINADQSLLPNISLGFVTLDDCEKDLTALARSVFFIPRAGGGDGNGAVVGIVGPSTSDQSVMISSLLGLFQIPVLGPHHTSETLSDKSRFPYFMRLMLSDRHQAAAVVDLVRHFGWSYVSVLHSDGDYERDISRHVEALLGRHGICLGHVQMIASDSAERDIDSAIGRMHAMRDARVVILFLQKADLRRLFSRVKSSDLVGRFFWISDDNLRSAVDWHLEDVVDGSLYVGYPGMRMPAFERYIRSLSWRNSTNPWLPLVFESLYNCSWKNGTDGPATDADREPAMASCYQYETLQQVTHDHWSAPIHQADGFLVYAKALHQLIADHCPEMFRSNSKEDLRRCISGPRLLAYMKRVSFPGYCGYVMFDDRGDLKLNSVVLQMRRGAPGGRQLVGEWDARTSSLRVDRSALDWGGSLNLAAGGVRSACGRPCAAGYVYQTRRVACCWDCVPCRDDEITTDNATGCRPCPSFSWPDAETRLTCHRVEPYYLKADSATGMSVIALSVAGAVLSLVFVAVYLAKADDRLLKASSKTLSIVTLLGCATTSAMASWFVTRPEVAGCCLRLAGFHLGVCVMYSPLVTKTSRLYRIFKGNSQPRFVSNQAQLILTAAIIVTQVILISVLGVLFPREPVLYMPSKHVRYVEIACPTELTSFIAPLAFNLLLVCICAVLGYITKGLPENFNESRYIVMSVATTLFLWVVFLPTYFSTVGAYRRTVYICACLLLNAYITMLGQFGPKVYAIYFPNRQPRHGNAVAASTSASPVPRTSTNADAALRP